MKKVDWKRCWTELIYTFTAIALRSQTLANIREIFQKIWHLVICRLITNIWWDILNSYIAWGCSDFFWIFRKNYKLREAETHCLQVCQCDTRTTHSEEQHRSFKQTGTTSIFSFRYQSCTSWPSGPLSRKNPCFGCNSAIYLVVVPEYTLLQLCSNAKQISLVQKI